MAHQHLGNVVVRAHLVPVGGADGGAQGGIVQQFGNDPGQGIIVVLGDNKMKVGVGHH